MSVCATEDGSEVTEGCPLVPKGKADSTDRLLDAESAVLGVGGNVLRLVGLYHANRGPHTFFKKMGEVPRYGGYMVNMLHYEDAAGLALSVSHGHILLLDSEHSILMVSVPMSVIHDRLAIVCL